MQFEKLVTQILNEGYFDSADIADIRRSQRADREREQDERSGDRSGRYAEDDDRAPIARKLETVQDANGNDVTNRNYVKFADDVKNKEHKIDSENGTRVDDVFTSYGKQGPAVKIWSSADKFGNSYGPKFKSGAWIVVPAAKIIVVK